MRANLLQKFLSTLSLQFRPIASAMILSIGLLLNSHAHAQKIKVQKIRNGKALVETNAQLEEGRVYYLTNGPISQDVSYSTDGLRSRKNSLSADFSYSSFSGDSATKTTNLSLKGKYGWNFVTTEFGPMLNYQNTTTSSTTTTAYLIGGFFDYNFQPNKDGVNQIFGLTAQAAFGSITPSSGTSYSELALSGGGFIKWFLFNTHLALRGDAGYEIDQISRSSGNVNNSGFYFSFGLSNYF